MALGIWLRSLVGFPTACVDISWNGDYLGPFIYITCPWTATCRKQYKHGSTNPTLENFKTEFPQANMDFFAEYCDDPTPANGKVIEGERTSGYYKMEDLVIVKCKDGFELIGNNYSSCTSLGNWQPPLGVCLSNEKGE